MSDLTRVKCIILKQLPVYKFTVGDAGGDYYYQYCFYVYYCYHYYDQPTGGCRMKPPPPAAFGADGCVEGALNSLTN
jgi:hypothetical protein